MKAEEIRNIVKANIRLHDSEGNHAAAMSGVEILTALDKAIMKSISDITPDSLPIEP